MHAPLRPFACTAILALLATSIDAQAPTAAAAAAAPAATALALPLAFEPLPDTGAAAFLARGPGYAARVSATGAALHLVTAGHHERVALSLPGADVQAQTAALEPLPGLSHYLLGNDPRRWRQSVPQHRKMRCADVWPGIDVVWYGNGRELEFDFVVRPGADVQRLRLDVEGVDALELQRNGDLRLVTAHADLVQRAPRSWQMIDGQRRPVASRYRIEGPRSVAIELGAFDAEHELVVDPVIAYATYFGGNGADGVHDLARDAQGNLYLTGLTTSANLRVLNAYQPALAGLYDFFVAKLDPSGSTLLYSTFVGGAAGPFGTDEWPIALTVDAQGRAIVLGRSEAPDFPTTANAFQPALAGKVDAVLFALSPNGSQLAFSTYVGGSGFDMDRDSTIGGSAGGVVVDAAGFVTVAGFTESSDLPLRNARQAQLQGTADVFLARFDSAGNVVYVSYLGGPGHDQMTALEAGPTGSVLLAGNTTDGWPTTAGAYDTSGRGGFVTELDPATQQIRWSTSFPSSIASVAVDPTGAIYMAGTSGGGVPTTLGAYRTEHGGAFNAHWQQGWVGKLDAAASALLWATYYGNASNDEGFSSVVVDDLGHAYTFGTTTNHLGRATSAPLLVKWNTEGSWPVYELEVGARTASGSVALLERAGSV